MTYVGPTTGTCVRSAWLTLGSLSVPLEDRVAGYRCTQLDLGYPSVRAVTNNRPDQHGTDDRTQFWGERVVSADIFAVVAYGGKIDALVDMFAPFMNVVARPVLHWILDRPGAPERVLTLRPANLSFPIVGPTQRNLHLQWVASDPLPRDPNIQSVTAWSGSGVPTGRTYPLTFPRIYPVGGAAGTLGTIRSSGSLAIQPLLRIYGPITQPAVKIVNSDNSGTFTVKFLSSFTLSAGHFVDVDTIKKTAYLDADPNQPAMASLDWTATAWPVVNVLPNVGTLSIGGSSTSPISQVQASWQDVYLS